jgi:hypothetical protein
MAKLENVKILDMVNGEPTRVEYNGEVYVKTEDDAKAGDLVRVIDAFYITCVEEGGFYDIFDRHDLLMFLDDDGDFRPYKLNRRGFETFRKVSETKASADLAERLAELERQFEALKERVVAKDVPKAESAPKFEVGDYVVPLPESDGKYAVTNTEMKLGKVTHVYSDGDIKIEIVAHKNEYAVGGSYRVESKHFRKATAEEIEKAAEEARWAKIGRKPGEFKKGDIVRLLEDSGAHEAGTLVEVHDNGNYKADDYVWVGEFDWYELVVPVEQRFDIAAEGARQ